MILVLLAPVLGAANAATIHVAQDGSGDATTIMAGLALSRSGDTVEVTGGTYTEDVTLPAWPVTLEGEAGSAGTTIIGVDYGSTVRVANPEAAGTVIRGFTITGGDCSGCSLPESGGAGVGVFGVAVELEDLVVTGNVGGAAVTLAYAGGSTLINSSVDENDAGIEVHQDDDETVTLTDVDVERSAGDGLTIIGGRVNGTSVTSSNNDEDGINASEGELACDHCEASENGFFGIDTKEAWFTDLTVTHNAHEGIVGGDVVISGGLISENFDRWSGYGAAVTGDDVRAWGVTFADNVGERLGGAVDAKTGELDGDLFVGNQALEGAAVYMAGDGSMRIVNTVFEGNIGSDAAVLSMPYGGDVTVTNVTALQNASGEVDFDVGGGGVLRVDNTIVADSAGAAFSINMTCTLTLTYSDLHNNAGGSGLTTDPTGTSGNIAIDPVFVDYAADGAYTDDLHLAAGSPLIDAGDPAILDLDGTRSDIGAYGGPGDVVWVDADGDGWSAISGDCDDANAAVNPAAVELCDGVDNNCDGVVDEGCATDSGVDSAIDSAPADTAVDSASDTAGDTLGDPRRPGKKSGCTGCSTARTSPPFALFAGLALLAQRRRRPAG